MKRLIIKLLEIYLFIFIGLGFILAIYLSERLSITFIVMFVLFVPIIFGVLFIHISNNDLLVEIRNALIQSNNEKNYAVKSGKNNGSNKNNTSKTKNKKSKTESTSLELEYLKNSIGQLLNEKESVGTSSSEESIPVMEIGDITKDGPFKIRNRFDQVTIGTLKDDQLHGSFEQFYPNESLKIKCTYKNGELDGKYQTFYADGSTESKLEYKNGKLVKN